MIIIPIIPKDQLNGFEVKFSAITKEMAFYLVNVFPVILHLIYMLLEMIIHHWYVYLHVLLFRILLLQKDIVILW